LIQFIRKTANRTGVQNDSLSGQTSGEVTDWYVKAASAEIDVVAVARPDLEGSKFNICEMVELTRVRLFPEGRWIEHKPSCL
jgi:hypothetical protein